MTKVCRGIPFVRTIMGAVLAWLVLLGQAQALSVTKTPGTTADCVSASGAGTKAWTNPKNAITTNASYATSALNNSSDTITQYLKCQNFGFSIPNGAIVTGITAKITRKTSSSTTTSTAARDKYVRIVKGGLIGSTDRATSTNYSKTLVTEAHGGSADLWGTTWTAADVNASNFGVAYAAYRTNTTRSRTISVDLISITVDYTGDATPPTVSSINRVDFNPRGGASASWTVTFSEPVSPVVAADFTLPVTGTITGQTITSVTGSGATWTVLANTGSGSGTLGLNLTDQDTILDTSGNKLGGTGTTGANNGSFTGQTYTIDKINPYVDFLPLTGATTTNASSVSWSVVFSKSVSGVDPSDFALAQGAGVSGASISSVTGSGTTYTVAVSTGSGSGTLGLNLVDNDSIVDSLGNKLGGAGTGNGNVTGPSYTIDKAAPVVSSIALGDANPTNQAVVSWDITFSKSVTGVDLSDFVLTGSATVTATLLDITASATGWVVTADTGICLSNCTLGLSLVDDDSIVDAVGNPLGGSGAANGDFTGAVYSLTASQPLAGYSMNENWTGATDQVTDSQGNAPGTSINGAQTSTGSCRYGIFHNGTTITQGYVEMQAFSYLATDFTITAWIRTTDRTKTFQRILIDDSTTDGYALSLGDGGAGKLRFYSYANSSAMRYVDTNAVIANNTWYFVAAAVDIANGQVNLYVFDNAGTLVTSTSSTFSGWGTDPGSTTRMGGESNSPATHHFFGNLDEVQVWDRTLSQAAIAKVLTQAQSCFGVSVDHYELSLPSTALSCLPSAVTVKACADASSPCTSTATTLSGQTATLTTSGASLGATTVTFDSTGVASTTLSYPSAANGATATVTLSGEQTTPSNARQCCPNGSSCSAANSCTATFSTAGFIVSSVAGGAAATVPAQTAGTSSPTYQLRAVKTGTTTQACEAALSGAQSVNWAHQCNNPTTCASANLMVLNGGSSTTIARNANSVSVGSLSSTAVSMVFDANGNAPFTFNYSDVGQVTLVASATANGAALSGSTNAFVVRPASFALSNVVQTLSPNAANPAAASAAGAKFAKAGEAFSATITAKTSTGATAPNFGRENTPEGVLLTSALVLPAGGAAGTLSNGTVAGGSFTGGVATVTNLSWSEVGILSLTPSVASGSYLGAGAVSGVASGNIGRFTPDHFTVTSANGALQAACGSSFTYTGQPMTYATAPSLTIVAVNSAGGVTTNYTGSFQKLLPSGIVITSPTSDGSNNGKDGVTRRTVSSSMNAGTLTNSAGTLTYTLSASDTFTYARNANALMGPITGNVPLVITAVAEPSGADGVASSGALPTLTPTGVEVRYGRAKLSNAYGSELLDLPMSLQSQYRTTSGAWQLNTADTCTQTTLAFTAVGADITSRICVWDTATAPGNSGKGCTTLPLASRQFREGGVAGFGGDFNLWLSKPTGGYRGAIDVSASVPAWLQYPWSGGSDANPVGRATFGVYKSPLVYRRENY